MSERDILEIFIPREKITPEMLKFFGFTEKQIEDFFKGIDPITVDTNIHDIKGVEFDEAEEIK